MPHPITMENLRAGSWAVSCLLDLGLSFPDMVRTYADILGRYEGREVVMRLQLCMSTSALIGEWIKSVAGYTKFKLYIFFDIVNNVNNHNNNFICDFF